MSNKLKQQQGIQSMQEPAASNIIPFSKQPAPQQLQNAIQSQEDIINVKTEISNDISEMVMENVMGMLTSYGALRNPEKVNTFDLMMLENSIQALLYRYYRIEHPLHEVTDDLFEIEEEEAKS